MTSLLVAYRSRPALLQTFLETLSRCHDVHSTELLLIDLGSPQGETDAIINPYRQHLYICHHWINFTGTFWKTKALNHGLLQVDTELVTIIDVDCLFPQNFLTSINHFFAHEENRAKKLGQRIRFLNPHQTERIQKNVDLFFHLKPEECPNLAHEEHAGIKTGNSHMTILTDTLIDAGGYDERYIGYGFEDHDLNMRLHVAGIETVINPTCELFHQWHRREPQWQNDQSDRLTRELFAANKAAGFPSLTMPIPSPEESEETS
jgi:predicted glycosyltransferase involved in capsule biosynthesis